MTKNDTNQVAIAPHYTIRLSGTGGQGLILAGRLLAEAASLFEDYDVVQTNSYGPEARGGASRSEVVIGKGDIDILHAPYVDGLICLSQKSCDSYYGDLRQGGALITDSELVSVVPTARGIEIPMCAIAQDLGNKMAANVVALGVLCSVTKIVSQDSLKKAVANRFPKAIRDINLAAVDAGFVAAQEVVAAKSERMRAVIPEFTFQKSS